MAISPAGRVLKIAEELLPDATPRQRMRVLCRTCTRFAIKEYQRCSKEKDCGNGTLYKPRANSPLEALTRVHDAVEEAAGLWGLSVQWNK